MVFASVGGEFFGYLVIQALMNLVTSEVRKEAELSSKHMKPYLADLEAGHAGAASEGS